MANPGIPTNGPYKDVPKQLPAGGDKKEQILEALAGYKHEAEDARKSGENPRDEKWAENLNLYWNRHDFSNKADWQAKETMPEVPAFVDRFAAAMKEALVRTPKSFYTVTDPVDKEHDVTDAIKRAMDAWLSTIGRNQNGTVIGFPAVFEEQMKMGALMATSGVVTWKDDVKYGRVALETVDPRNVWLDHTYRNLYRRRRIELDKHDLIAMAKATTRGGKPIFDLQEITDLLAHVVEQERIERAEMSGTGQQYQSNRKPISIDEWIATVVGQDGKVLADRDLMVVANDDFLIRGPEKNPFWHGKDWLMYTPLVTAPLSPYGRTYMEDFGSVAKTFTELTNLLLDAVFTSTLNAFVLVPSMLQDPSQASTGVAPNKTFLLEDGFAADEFAETIQLGNLDQGGVQIWQALKSELSEAAGINEIGLGQFAPNSRTSATEIMQTQQSSSAIVRSVAHTVETQFLSPTLDLVWKTGMQHVRRDDPAIRGAVGEELFGALIERRKEVVSRPITFQAHGISMMIEKSQQLQQLLQLMQVIAQNEALTAAFMEAIDIRKLVRLLMVLSNIDVTDLALSQREQMVQELMGGVAQRTEGAQPSDQQRNAAGNAAQQLGIGRQG